MLLPIKLVTGKQPAKKQKVQKDLGLVITPEMQRNIEATNPQGIVERAKRIEAVRAEQEQFAQRTKQGQAQLAYEQTLKQAAQQPKQAKAFVPKLQQLEKQISPPPVSKEVVMQKRVPKTPEGLATISILTDYGTTNYIATPEETKILEFGTIDEGVALRNRLRQEAQAEFANQGLKKKRKTAEAYVSDTVNAALNPNFVDEQVANTLREQLDDKIFDFAAKYSVGGKLVKTGRDALKSASDKLKNVDDVGAQVTAGLIDSLINPVSGFATATANVYDPTATTEERVGAAGNIGLYALSAIPVTEAVGASVRAFKTGADVAEGLTLAARSLLESTVPGRYISRKTTINDLVNVLEKNGQMGGKTRGQLAKEFATGGKEFSKATGQAPELFYNKYLNDLAEKATPATTTPELPAQFDLTKPQATAINPVIDEALRTADEITSQAPTQVEDLGAVVDDLVGKTEPVVTEPTVTPVVEPPIAQNPDIGIYKISADKADEIDLQYGDDLQQAYINKYPDASNAELTDIQNNDFREWKKQNPNASLESFYEEQIPKLDPYWQPVIHPKVKLPATPNAIRQIQNIAPSEKAISKLEDLPKEAKAIEQWTENNLLGELLPSDPNFDVRKADAVGQHYRIGNFPRGTSFDEWYEDLKNAIETQSQNRVLDELTDTSWLEDARNELYRIIYGSKDKSTSPFGKQWIQNNPQRIIQLRIYDKRANKSLIPTRATKRFVSLEEIPAWMREDLLGRVRDDDFVYMTAADYARWKSEGASAFGGTIKPKRMSDYANYKGDFYDDAQGLDEVMVPLEVVKEKYAELNTAYKKSKEGDKFAKYTPTKKDLERAFDNYFDVNQPITPVVEPPVTPPTSIVDEIEQGMGASKSTAPPPPTEPTVTGIPETPEPITSGISNKANLSSEELGLISEAPQGKGRSASQVVEETINRNPSDKELEILAGKVANGQALNADDTAVLLVGQGRFNLRVFNAREALDNAIKSGASAQDIDQLRDAWLLAQADATNFAKQIQRGKSGWSDVGRVLQQKTDLFTGELSQIKANIIAEAELRKGRTLTDAEQENYKTMVDKLIGENKKLEEELAKLKATRNEATQEGRVRRTRTSASLDKLIAKKENTIRVNKATVTQKLNNEIPVATSTRLGQFITEYKLLNPYSRFVDVASNVVKLVDNIATTPVARLIDIGTSKVLKSEPIYRTSYLSKDRWENLLMNSFEKIKADLKIVAAGGDVETIEKFGGAQGIGSKFAGFTDVPFKAIYHEDGKFLAADVKARELLKEELGAGNFGKKDIEARRTEILNNIEEHPDVIMNAEEYALNETFNNHNWVSKINQRLKSGMSPASKATYDEAIGRFSKVITNVAIDVADRTGLGVARGIYNIADAIKSGKNLTVAERMVINKMITKGMVGMPLMYLGIKNWDKIEGEIRGVQQKYIDYGDLGKLGGPIAIFLHGASIGRAMNELPEDKVNDFVLATTARLPFNTPFINNLKDIIEVVTNPNSKTLATFGAKKASNLLIMPFIKEIAMRMDTEKGFQTGMEPEREKYPKGSGAFDIVKGEFQSKIPGLRQQLPLKNQKVGRPDE